MREERNPKDWAEARSHIFALYSKLGIQNNDNRHQLQEAVTSCSSLKLMTNAEHQNLIAVLEIIAAQPEEEQDAMLQRVLAVGSCEPQPEGLPIHHQAPQFASINLEATINLVDIDSATFPVQTHPVTLVVRQGIEILLTNQEGKLEPTVFIELHEGQVRLLVWDELQDSHEDEPTIHILKTKNVENAVPF